MLARNPGKMPAMPAPRLLVFLTLLSAFLIGGCSPSEDSQNEAGNGIGTLWVANKELGLIRRVNSATGKFQDIDTATAVQHIVFGAGSVWAVGEEKPTIYRLDPSTHQITASIDVDGPLRGIAANDDGVWVLDDGQGGSGDRPRVLRVDPASDTVVATIDVGETNDQLDGISVDQGGVYVAVGNGFAVVRIDPKTNKIAASELSGQAGGYGWGEIAAAQGRVWLADQYSDLLHELDPTTVKPTASYPIDKAWDGHLVAGKSSVFISYGKGEKILALDPDSGKLSMEINTEGKPRCMTLAKGTLVVGLVDTDGGAVRLIDETNGKLISELPGIYPDEIAVQ